MYVVASMRIFYLKRDILYLFTRTHKTLTHAQKDKEATTNK